MKILIAGLGSIGRRHLRNLQDMNIGERADLILSRRGGNGAVGEFCDRVVKVSRNGFYVAVGS